jgi:hypothetical protein
MLGLGNSLTGGAVTEAAWAPSDISSLIHWYKYNTGITQDGEGDITAWADQEGSNDLTPSGDTDDSPEYDSGAVKFVEAADDLEWGSALSLGTFSFYFRYETNDVSSDWMIKGGSTDWVKVHDTSEIRVKIAARMDWDVTGGALATDTKINLGIDRATNGDIGVYINNSAQSVQGGYTGNAATSTAFDITKIGSPLVTIKMYEILVFNDVLSSGDKTLLNTYLNTI